MNPARWFLLFLALCVGIYEAHAYSSGGRLPTISHDQWDTYLAHRWWRWAVLAGMIGLWWHWFVGFNIKIGAYEL